MTRILACLAAGALLGGATSSVAAQRPAPQPVAAAPAAARTSAPPPSAKVARPLPAPRPAPRAVEASYTIDSIGNVVPVTDAETARRLSFRREVFAYSNGGRRDPFSSLMTTGEIRPLISDLRLVAVALDAEGGNSVAILRDLTTNEQYRARVGQLLGRLRVTRIARKDVTFTIEEFGYSRQETLSLGDSANQRTQQ